MVSDAAARGARQGQLYLVHLARHVDALQQLLQNHFQFQLTVQGPCLLAITCAAGDAVDRGDFEAIVVYRNANARNVLLDLLEAIVQRLQREQNLL